MKIRIHDNSIRLRLNRDEVDQVGRRESVVCSTQFPTGERFGYTLVSSVDTPATNANFSGDTITVTLTEAEAQHWALTETEVSIAVATPIADGSLALLIEKDFECLDPREGEDQSNRFRNPKAALQSGPTA